MVCLVLVLFFNDYVNVGQVNRFLGGNLSPVQMPIVICLFKLIFLAFNAALFNFVISSCVEELTVNTYWEDLCVH